MKGGRGAELMISPSEIEKHGAHLIKELSCLGYVAELNLMM
jgi:hypothetical protein